MNILRPTSYDDEFNRVETDRICQQAPPIFLDLICLSSCICATVEQLCVYIAFVMYIDNQGIQIILRYQSFDLRSTGVEIGLQCCIDIRDRISLA